MSDDALQTNAADAEQVKQARETTRRRELEDAAIVRQQLGTYDGRRFVWKVLTMAGLYGYIGGDVEAVYTALGRRALGLELLADVNQHPELYLQMQNEAIAREKLAREENRAAHVRPRTRAK